jgi:hypothetical protein
MRRLRAQVRVSAPRGAPDRRTWPSSRVTALSNKRNIRFQRHCAADTHSAAGCDNVCSGRWVTEPSYSEDRDNTRPRVGQPVCCSVL